MTALATFCPRAVSAKVGRSTVLKRIASRAGSSGRVVNSTTLRSVVRADWSDTSSRFGAAQRRNVTVDGIVPVGS